MKVLRRAEVTDELSCPPLVLTSFVFSTCSTDEGGGTVKFTFEMLLSALVQTKLEC